MPNRLKQDYTAIHAKIVQLVNDKPGLVFGEIFAGVGDLAKDWRVVDRRLQALKVLRLIQYSRKGGWVPFVEPKKEA